MEVTEDTVIDQIVITEGANMLVRRATWFLKDGVRVAGPSYHRSSYDPADNLDAIKGEASIVKAIAALVWTPDVIKAATERREAAAAVLAALATPPDNTDNKGEAQ